MTLSSRHRIRNSSPGGLRPSTLPLGHGGSPKYWLSHVDGEETFFVSFKPPRSGTAPRTLASKAAVLTTTLGPPPRRCGTTTIQAISTTSWALWFVSVTLGALYESVRFSSHFWHFMRFVSTGHISTRSATFPRRSSLSYPTYFPLGKYVVDVDSTSVDSTSQQRCVPSGLVVTMWHDLPKTAAVMHIWEIKWAGITRLNWGSRLLTNSWISKYRYPVYTNSSNWSLDKWAVTTVCLCVYTWNN